MIFLFLFSYSIVRNLVLYLTENLKFLPPVKQLLPELDVLKNWETTSITSSEDKKRKYVDKNFLVGSFPMLWGTQHIFHVLTNFQCSHL